MEKLLRKNDCAFVGPNHRRFLLEESKVKQAVMRKQSAVISRQEECKHLRSNGCCLVESWKISKLETITAVR